MSKQREKFVAFLLPWIYLHSNDIQEKEEMLGFVAAGSGGDDDDDNHYVTSKVPEIPESEYEFPAPGKRAKDL